MTIFYMGASMAGAFSGLLAFAIGQLDGTWGYRGWRWIFCLEGKSISYIQSHNIDPNIQQVASQPYSLSPHFGSYTTLHPKSPSSPPKKSVSSCCGTNLLPAANPASQRKKNSPGRQLDRRSRYDLHPLSAL